METKKTLNGKALSACMLLAIVLSATPAIVNAAVFTTATQTFSDPLLANVTPRAPASYQFGTGTWAGSVDSVNSALQYTITIVGATPNTSLLIRVSFVDASGNVLTRAYGQVTTDQFGNAFDSEKSQIYAGTVRIILALFDKTNFTPPLQVLISDPEIGGDVPL